MIKLSRYMRLASMVLLAGVVTGCVSEAELQANDRGRCGSFGFQPGSSEFGNCMMRFTLQRDEIDAERRRDTLRDTTLRSIARDERRARDERQRLDDRAEYERARARREGCERNVKPIYC